MPTFVLLYHGLRMKVQCCQRCEFLGSKRLWTFSKKKQQLLKCLRSQYHIYRFIKLPYILLHGWSTDKLSLVTKGDLECRLHCRLSFLLHDVTLGSMETLFAHFRLAEQEEGQFYYAILLNNTFNWSVIWLYLSSLDWSKLLMLSDKSKLYGRYRTCVSFWALDHDP